MRLLRSNTLEFENFEEEDIPPYAILSHRWGREEVSFQEMREGSGHSKAGYYKIKRCGEIAAENGKEYFWADTCCIDKSSSAELSEAINSMYTWYRNASVCYAYLSDVSATSSPHPVYPTVSTFGSSEWFTRGWTLQELIASSDLIFLSKEWERIGVKDDLKEHIEEITGIRKTALEGADLGLFSVAERMSWASKRKTTRVEDRAYSLMGIFGINMPLLYGEREKSFIRLQEEIMKSSDDQSILAWTDTSLPDEDCTGLLARSPEHFTNSGHISSLGRWGMSGTFSMTNKGLCVELYLVSHGPEEEGIFSASLDCFVGRFVDYSPCIRLIRIHGGDSRRPQFARIRGGCIYEIGPDEKTHGEYRMVYVRQNQVDSQNTFWYPATSRLFQIQSAESPIDLFPQGLWNSQTGILCSATTVGKIGGASFNMRGKCYMVIFGLSQLGDPWTQMVEVQSFTPYKYWNWYEATGKEVRKSAIYIGDNDVIEGVATPIGGYQVPAFKISVTICDW